MAKVSIFDYTGKGLKDKSRAARLLVATKDTRLGAKTSMSRALAMTDDDLEENLEYMRKTIKSSWEFIDISFLVEDVTRACAQQITRTRTGSYAMQSLRIVNASELGIENPYPINSKNHKVFSCGADHSKTVYDQLIANGSSAEDARGILPLNTHSNIVCKYNFRAFVDLIKARSSLRVQGEYADVIWQMKKICIEIWPWSSKFFINDQQVVIEELERISKELGITVGTGHGWELAKLADLLRK